MARERPRARARFFCEQCGAEVRAGAPSCPSCGATFTAVKCPECGYEGRAPEFRSGCPACGYAALKGEPGPGQAPPRPRERRRGMPVWLSRVLLVVLAAALAGLVIVLILQG